METSEKCLILIKNELENKVLLLQTIFRCLAHIRIFTCSVKCDEELMVLLPPCSLHSFPSCTSSCSRKLNHLMERPNGVKCRGCVLTMVPLYSTKPIFHYPKKPCVFKISPALGMSIKSCTTFCKSCTLISTSLSISLHNSLLEMEIREITKTNMQGLMLSSN